MKVRNIIIIKKIDSRRTKLKLIKMNKVCLLNNTNSIYNYYNN